MMKNYFLVLLLSFSTALLFAQEYDDFVGAGHDVNVTVTSSDNQSNAANTINGDGLDLDIQGASKFLLHTTLGSTMADVEAMTNVDIVSWIDDQIEVPPSTYTEHTVEIIFGLYEECIENLGDSLCAERFNITPSMFRYAWWHNTMHSEDKLRQRVALALSEILVISDQSELRNVPHGLAAYYDILSLNAFGNYRDILLQVTYNPSMGFYLSTLNNPKTLPDLNINPDENYAREIMQLFTIGLYELNLDGSRKIDPNTGQWIPTYDNDDIKGLAKVFTGMAGSVWADEDNTSPVQFGRGLRQYSVLDPMKVYPFWHEQGEKTIVGDYTIPAGLTGDEDIYLAVDHLFNHPNVGPFISHKLIQRLIKSNPSPGYIERVATVFNDNGSGERGDMEAVIKAILLDEEALQCYDSADETNGMLLSPILRYTNMMIGLQARTESDWFWNDGAYYQALTEQHPMSSPTVFNFYSPDYVPDAEFAYLNMVGPEFEILNSSTSSNYVNYLIFALMQRYIRVELSFPVPNILNGPLVYPYISNPETYRAVLSDEKWKELQKDPVQLVDYLDLLLANGQLSDDTKSNIVASLESGVIADTYLPDYAAFLIMIHPECIVKE